MSYTALYRKFRPDTFNNVKGQDHIVVTLKNQIKADRIGHAYLFCGTRGTGKTSVAKLLAKVVNCEKPIDGSPCNECKMCKGIANQTSMNVIEIDAASNNGVDNVREIVEEVRYSPTEGRYKVYIIDEVHMLSPGAFNALLKTIEEPPSYVIFILATTEVHKIPATILSRCQRYDFKRITVDVITKRLIEQMEEENIEIEEKALRYVAKMADGSFRDALSLLDQCISYYIGEKITYDNILEVLGAVDTDTYANLLRLIQEQDVGGCIRLVEDIEGTGRELGQFNIDFIWYLRNLLLLKTSQDVSDIIIEVSSENLELMKNDAKKIEEQVLIRYIRVLSELFNQIRYATRKRVLIEMALIKLCKPQMDQNMDALYDRLRRLEEKLENGVTVVNQGGRQGKVDKASKDNMSRPSQEKKKEVLPEALPEDVKEVAKNWRKIVSMIVRKAPAMSPILQGATLSIDTDLSILIVTNNIIDKGHIDKKLNIKLICDTITEMIHKQVKVKTKYIDKDKERMEDVVDLSKIIKAPIQYEQ